MLADRRLLLTAGLRADRSSANGSPGKYFFYPKLAASYLFERPFGGVEEFKLRGAYGQTGNRAAVRRDVPARYLGHDRRQLRHVHRRRGRATPTFRPERQKEFEAGFDATLANGRAQLTFTFYQRNITRPAAGADRWRRRRGPGDPGLQLGQHAAEPGGRGLAHAVADPDQGRELDLPDDLLRQPEQDRRLTVPTFQTGGFAPLARDLPDRGGRSATQIFGLVGNDASGNAIAGKVGDATPDFQMSFSNDVDFHRFTLGFLFDWKQGGDIINLTEFLYDAGQNSKDFIEPGEAAGCLASARGSPSPTCSPGRTSSCGR